MPKAKKTRTKSLKASQKFSIKRSSLFVVSFAVVGVFVIWKALAAGSTPCAPAAPRIYIENNYAWGALGSWGTPGQQLDYFISVDNDDTGNCTASTFTVGLNAPSGFTVTQPSTTLSIKPASIGYMHIKVTSPTVIADGDYPLTATAIRAGMTTAVTGPSYYKVYSSDTTAPTVYWEYPSEGLAVGGKGKTGSTTNLSFESQDNHAVKKLEIYLDGNLMTTTNCDNVTFTCGASYKLSLRGLTGAHTATFKSYDWFNNLGQSTTHFTVN